MPDILTVTLNPALDISTSVARVVHEDKLRCDEPVYDPGGGGTNVARAIHLLGGRARAFVAVGGFRGEQFIELLKEDGVEPVCFRTGGETRLSLAVTDRSDSRQYRFVMPGPRWGAETAFAALEAIGAAMPEGGLVVLSGSQPPGVPAHFPTQLAAMVEEKGARLILDTSGPPLYALMEVGSARQHVLRLDRAESEALAGRALSGVEAFSGFARELVQRGVAETVVLAMGAEGSVLAGGGHAWHAVTPAVVTRSKVGAGDSFVGAFTLALARGLPPEQALCHGVAAASAAVMSDATTLCLAEDVEALLGQVRLTRL
jgi:6-phosphofructokinase 2